MRVINLFLHFTKLDNLSKDELVKLVKKYIVLQKQLKTKNEGKFFSLIIKSASSLAWVIMGDVVDLILMQNPQPEDIHHYNNTNGIIDVKDDTKDPASKKEEK